MRWLGAAILALSAGSCTLAAAGLAVAPHRDPAGTPVEHAHALVTLRYPLLLGHVGDGAASDGPAAGAGWSIEEPGALALASLALATLLGGAVRLTRPRSRIVGAAPAGAVAAQQWDPDPRRGPPRAVLLVTA